MADVAWDKDKSPGIFLVGYAFHKIFGVSILFILKYIYPFYFPFSLEILGMYLVVRSLTENRMASALSAAYIALSPAQYHLSEWHMYKMMLGQTLLLNRFKKLENKYLFIALCTWFDILQLLHIRKKKR